MQLILAHETFGLYHIALIWATSRRVLAAALLALCSYKSPPDPVMPQQLHAPRLLIVACYAKPDK